jgi:ABC-type multidrug transport system fused ATPase/permease subunit
MDCHNDMTFNKILLGLVEGYPDIFGYFFLILLFQPVRDIGLPHFVGKLYSAAKGEGGSIGFNLGVIIALIVVIQIVSVAADYVEVKLHPAIYKNVRELLMKAIFKDKETKFSEVDVGQVLSKVVKLPGVIHHHIDLIRSKLIPLTMTMIASLGYFFWVDWRLGLALFGVLTVLGSSLAYTYETCSPVSMKSDEKFNLVMSHVNDVLKNMTTVMKFSKLQDEFDRMDEHHQGFIEYSEKTFSCSLLSKYVVIPCLLAFLLFVGYFGYSQNKAGLMTQGTFVSVLLVLFVVLKDIFSVLEDWKYILFRTGVIEHGLHLFEQCTIPRKPYTAQAKTTKGISIQSVDFAYVSADMQRPVFKDFNLTLKSGEKTVIIGGIGSGKSTLVSLLLKYQTPQAGEIFLDGIPYSTIDTTELRRRICYIPQSPILLNRSVYDNIVYGLSPEPSKEEVTALMVKENLQTFLSGLPNGIDTSVGLHGSKLSGGQRQIVWVLKSLMTKPELVVLDEPTASIDDTTKGIVHRLLTETMASKTVVMITHDPYLLSFADRILTMDKGNIVDDKRQRAKAKVTQ